MNSTQDVMQSALFCGKNAAFSAGGMVVHAACLPVTLPLHVACKTTDLVCGVAGNVLDFALGGNSSSGERSSSTSPIDGLVHNVVNFVPFVVGQTGKISKDIGGAVVQMVLPVKKSGSEKDATSSGESSAEKESFLNRLRLDIQVPELDEESQFGHLPRATPSDISKFLLRVDDIDVFLPPNPAAVDTTTDIKALYIDLGKEFSDKGMTTDALTKLRKKGLDMESTNPFRQGEIEKKVSSGYSWKPEGATAKLMQKLSKLSNDEYYKRMEDTVLIWSGKSQGPKFQGSDTPIFMGKGVVKRSPRELLDLMWDSSRASEYNNFNLGRKDVLVIEDDILEGGAYGAKVIKSETKVPFTGISITLSTLMHATSLDGGVEEGFIIVSRSCKSGMAGCHFGNSKRVDDNSKSEILIAVNIFRAVPGKPDLCELTSVSQVSAAVPNFLSFRIGVLGVEDFFKNIR